MVDIPANVIVDLEEIANNPDYIAGYYEGNFKDGLYMISGADGGPLDGYGDDEPEVKALRAAFEALFDANVAEYAAFLSDAYRPGPAFRAEDIAEDGTILPYISPAKVQKWTAAHAAYIAERDKADAANAED